MALERLKRGHPNFDYEVVGYSEIDPNAIKLHDACHPSCKNYGDVSKIDWEKVPDFDLFTYSFPCTDISAAGQQRGLSEGSNNRKRKKLELERLYTDIVNKRSDFQWKLAHELCKRYDLICLEDLNLEGMTKRWGRKMSDLAHGDFVVKLEHVAKKYGVRVHKIDRFFPSSRLCTCGYKNDGLRLADRVWTCPSCGIVHPRDLFAAENILRRGIVELGSGGKPSEQSQGRSHASHPTIPCK